MAKKRQITAERSKLTTANLNECKDCKNAEGKEHWGVYHLKCKGCRDRMQIAETCKIHREILHKSLEKYGEVGEWKVEPHCGCTNRCKRRQYSNSH